MNHKLEVGDLYIYTGESIAHCIPLDKDLEYKNGNSYGRIRCKSLIERIISSINGEISTTCIDCGKSYMYRGDFYTNHYLVKKTVFI